MLTGDAPSLAPGASPPHHWSLMGVKKMADKAGPQDHKEKTVKPEVVSITLGAGDDAREVPGKRVTVSGVTVEVPDEAFDDFEVLDDIRAVQDQNDASRLPSLLRRFVGDDYRRVMGELRGTSGRVSIEAGSTFVLDLIRALSPN